MFTDISNYLTKASLICLSIALVSPLPVLNRGKRSTSWIESPCLHFTSPPNTTLSITENINDLIQRTADLGSTTTDTIGFMINKYSMPTFTTNKLDEHSFIETPAEVVDEDTNTTTILTAHVHLLFDMYYHIHESHTSGEIASLTEEDNIGDKLEYIQEQIYDIICAVNIALIKQLAPTVEVTEEPVYSDEFNYFNQSYTFEQYRAYILLRDIERIMGNLHNTYTEMV